MSAFTIDSTKGLHAEVTDRSIGPAHDPYGETSIRIWFDDGPSAEYVSNGLGMHRALFFPDQHSSAREERWWSCGGDHNHREHRQLELKCMLLARRTFGITFDDAYELACHQTYYEDPMGSLSAYI